MKPSPGSPSRWSSGTKQSSITTSAVSEARVPSLFSFLPGRKPSIPCSRTKAEMLWWRGPSGSVTACTTQTSPTVPWVVKVLAPLRIQPPSTLTARERVPAASEPASGSVRLQAPILAPVARSGSQRRRCSSLPNLKMWLVHSELWAATLRPTAGSTADSSSMTRKYST